MNCTRLNTTAWPGHQLRCRRSSREEPASDLAFPPYYCGCADRCEGEVLRRITLYEAVRTRDSVRMLIVAADERTLRKTICVHRFLDRRRSLGHRYVL